MKSYRLSIIARVLTSVVIFITAHIPASADIDLEKIENLNLRNGVIKSIRNDIRKTLGVTKGGRDPALLPDLKFYKYTIKKDDNFWKIITRTSLNMDTLLTVNSLSSPYDIKPGRTLFIPNMRGIIYETEKNESIENIAGKFGIKDIYITKANKLNDGVKNHLFIPCAKISDVERSLFLGVGFANPLTDGRRTSSFGNRVDPFNKKFRFHSGVDLACPIRSKVYASRDGVVSFAGFYGGYGRLIILRHSHGYSSYYGHLSSIKVKRGTQVKRGQVIGLSGNSGRSTGPHLHFEVRKKSRPINPGRLLKVK